MGFDHFYGFNGGETDQRTPFLFRDKTQVFPWVGHPGYNLTTDVADDAINYMRGLNNAAPNKPFFLYYVLGGSHAPHQPTPEWIKKISDMHLFDQGWEKLRETIFANQKRLGVIPANTQLTPWPDGQPQYGGAALQKWETLSPDEKKLFIRQADVFGAYTAYTDHEIGRVIQEVEDEGKLDNTLIIYISGDSAEGSTLGTPFDMADPRRQHSKGKGDAGGRVCPRTSVRFNALSSASSKYWAVRRLLLCTFAKWRPTPSLSGCWARPEVIRRPSQRRFSWDLAQAARSPSCAAAADPATPATPDRATPAPPDTATPATPDAAAPDAAAPDTAATAATNNNGQLHAAANAFLIEGIEGGETDVDHFLFAKNEALIGRDIVRLRDTGSGHRGCGCITHQRKTQSGGTQHLHGGGFGCAFLLRSLLNP
jgi:Sulfatase